MVSVIVPIYNGEKHLSRCLDSLLNQSVSDQLEIILIDDGSIDHSPKIIDKYVQNNSNIRALHIPNQGVSNARNQGIDMANGDYLAFVDADDYIDPDYFEQLLSGVNGEADIICAGYVADYPDCSVPKCSSGRYSLNRKQAIEAYLDNDEMDPNMTDKLFLRKTIGSIRLDKRFRLAEDRYFLFECLKNASQIEILPVCGYHYVMSKDSACRSSFSEKKLDPLIVANMICAEIREMYPDLYEKATSMEMDLICGVYGEMEKDGGKEAFHEQYLDLKRKIRQYPVMKKKKYSSRKHLLAFVLAKLHPRLYNFVKYNLKLQYR